MVTLANWQSLAQLARFGVPNLVNCLRVVNSCSGFSRCCRLCRCCRIGWRGRFLAFFEDERVVVALDLENAAVAFAFAFRDGVCPVPGLEKLAVLLGKVDAVGLFHVEVYAGDESPDFFAGLDLLVFKVDDGFALAVHGDRAVRPLVEHEVAAVAVYFADGGVEVVQVAFHDLERGIVRAAVLAAAVAPTGEVLTHVVRRDDVFPFDALGALEALALFVFARLVVAGTEIDGLLVDVPAVAVERSLEVTVIDALHLFTGVAVVVVLGGCFRVHLRERECSKNAKNQSDSAC